MSETEVASIDALREQLAEIEDERDRLLLERDEYKKLYDLVRLELERTRRHMFGQKSEKVDPAQTQLAFAELSAKLEKLRLLAGEEGLEPEPKAKGKARPHGRRPLPDTLPIERIVLEPPPAAIEGCDKIGEEVSETLEYRHASYVRVQVVRPKYAKRIGEDQTEVVIAPPPAKPIDKGLAGPALLAKVIVSKFADSLPFNRQARIFEREGIPLARSTLGDWAEQCHGLLQPIVQAQWQDALRSDYLAVDATGVLVQAKEQCRRGHFWVVISDNGHVLFRYTRRHTKQSVKELLGGYAGYIQADAATVYDFLYTDASCIEVGCWAHCRRRFFDALGTDQDRAFIALGFIRKLFEVDRASRELPRGKRKKDRAKAKPVLKAFFEWADAEALQVLPESPIGKAITYARNQRQPLSRFLDDDRLRLTNNFSERELRREAVGRKNWLFVGSDEGATWNTTFTTLIASCQHHGIEPWAYLRDVLCLVSDWPASRVLDLSPKRWKQTLEQPETQRRLNANVFRAISVSS